MGRKHEPGLIRILAFNLDDDVPGLVDSGLITEGFEFGADNVCNPAFVSGRGWEQQVGEELEGWVWVH
jgi:hypothetical protein